MKWDRAASLSFLAGLRTGTRFWEMSRYSILMYSHPSAQNTLLESCDRLVPAAAQRVGSSYLDESKPKAIDATALTTVFASARWRTPLTSGAPPQPTTGLPN